MADSKLQDLNSGVGVATLVDADFFYAEQGTTAKFCLASVMKTYMWLTPTLGGHLAGGGFDITGLGTLSMTEQAAANADVAGDGQLWVKTATPNELWFTDDAGTDFQIASLAGTETFTNKTLTSPTIATMLIDDGDAGLTVTSADQTHAAPTATIPDIGDAADSFVMNDTAATLTGKTLTSPTITTMLIDDGDAGLTLTSADQTHATPVVTVPDIGDAADNMVLEDTAQTLTNKTLTAPVIGGLTTHSITAGITADVGSIQGGSPLTTDINEISTCANAGDAVTLPSAKAGYVVRIINNGANAADVFPASGDDCGGGADTAVSLAAGANITYLCYDSGTWVAAS